MSSAEIPRLLLDWYFADIEEYTQHESSEFDFRQNDVGVLNSWAALVGTSRSDSMRGESVNRLPGHRRK
jgi:hypothetical protein